MVRISIRVINVPELVYRGVMFHEKAERILREVITDEGLELIDNRAIHCYDEWFSNGGTCEPWYSVCIAYVNKGVTEKSYSLNKEGLNVRVQITPLEKVAQVKIEVYDR